MTSDDQWKAREPNVCPLCKRMEIMYMTDCFDKSHAKICELWFCHSCGGFFPRQLDVTTLKPEPRAVTMTQPPSSNDKRRAPRFPVQFVVQVDFNHVDDDGAAKGGGDANRKEKLSEPLVAMVINAGAGGLCFRYPESVVEGRVVRIKISLPSVPQSFYALGRVVRSTRLPDGGFGLGVEFVDVDSEYRDALKRYVSLT